MSTAVQPKRTKSMRFAFQNSALGQALTGSPTQNKDVEENFPDATVKNTSKHFGKPFPTAPAEIPKFLILAIQHVEDAGAQVVGIFKQNPSEEKLNSAIQEVSSPNISPLTCAPINSLKN